MEGVRQWHGVKNMERKIAIACTIALLMEKTLRLMADRCKNIAIIAYRHHAPEKLHMRRSGQVQHLNGVRLGETDLSEVAT